MANEANIHKLHRTLLVLLCGFVLGVLFLGVVLLAYRAGASRIGPAKWPAHDAAVPIEDAGGIEGVRPSKLLRPPGSNRQRQGSRSGASKNQLTARTANDGDGNVPVPGSSGERANAGVLLEAPGIAGSRTS